MRNICIALFFSVVLLPPWVCRADAPATEFFVLETATLLKLAPADDEFDTISSAQLSKASLAHGWFTGSATMTFSTAVFRIDARFYGSAHQTQGSSEPISYSIHASKDQTSWNIVAEDGIAKRQGKQFITVDWRKQPVTVVFRFLDLKQ